MGSIPSLQSFPGRLYLYQWPYPSSFTKLKMLLEVPQNYLLLIRTSLWEKMNDPSWVLGHELGSTHSRDSSGFFSPTGCALLPQQSVLPCSFAALELTPVTSVMARALDDQGRFSAQPSSDFQNFSSPGSIHRLGGFQKMRPL